MFILCLCVLVLCVSLLDLCYHLNPRLRFKKYFMERVNGKEGRNVNKIENPLTKSESKNLKPTQVVSVTYTLDANGVCMESQILPKF